MFIYALPKVSFVKYLLLGLFIAIWTYSFCHAEETPSVAAENAGESNSFSDCSITVRSIKGIDHTEDRTDSGHAIDKSFSDIKDQLEDLPFAHFEQIDLIKKKTDFDKEAHFNPRCAMGNLHKLEITPHALSDGKVDVTIGWTAPNGETMVASRMKFPNGQSMVLGTEHPKQTCTIMVVKVDCQR